MSWNIQIPKKVVKNIGKLPASVKKTLFLLMREIEEDGPVRGNWKNFTKLEKDRYTTATSKRATQPMLLFGKYTIKKYIWWR